MRKHFVIFLVSVIFIFLCITPLVFVGFAFGTLQIHDWRAEQSLPVYKNADFIFEDIQQYTGNYRQRNFYYASSEPIDEIKVFYENLNLSFIDNLSAYDLRKEGYWIFASWYKDVNLIAKPTPCDYREVFDCVDITLIDANQKSLIANIYPKLFQESPLTGTLIILSYYIPDPA